MNWPTIFYIAVVVSEFTANAKNYKPLYEESFVLIEANSDEDARAKILQEHGQPIHYQNQYGETITWALKHIVDAQPLLASDIGIGQTIYSRNFRDYEAYKGFEVKLSGEVL